MFLKHGIEAVKMTDIADACGVGVATLYRYFGTKTAVTIAAMTYLWTDLKEKFRGIYESQSFLNQNGCKRIHDLMKMYLQLFDKHPSFMRLLGEFDLMLVSEEVPKAMLYDYERSIINFYPVVEASYLAGIKDGSIRSDIDFKVFYLTYTHAMMELCKKILRGDLLPSDDFAEGKTELNMLIDMAVSYLRKN
ncbi:MAG: TetR/AcrR family transcriptional regulator [Oscillospiraceae bacterium]|nr:TetR/AcrR family transcriptional regulator [Oscillospiraceae bacterium]MBR5723043.1 TetR/AcrR family transcriptional regulator [Oscillospiraceae bacterium]